MDDLTPQDPLLRDTFDNMIRPIVEDKFLHQTGVVHVNKALTDYRRKPLRKRRELSPFGFDFFHASIEVHPFATEHEGGKASTRMAVYILKGNELFDMGVIEVAHEQKERDLDI